jgi:hypothetical protein
MRAAIYARLSTVRRSPEMQRREMREYCDPDADGPSLGSTKIDIQVGHSLRENMMNAGHSNQWSGASA